MSEIGAMRQAAEPDVDPVNCLPPSNRRRALEQEVLASGRGAWRMVAVLTLFAMLASVDKNFLTLVVPSVKADFGLSDVQVGLLIGPAFAVANVAISIPAGWLADRGDRRFIAMSGVLLWSVMAASGGLARSYGHLFLARVGVGLGEGISPPASYSLIRDGVPARRRGLAYAIFALGTPLGTGLAFVIGGLLITAIGNMDLTGVPLLGGMAVWQVALLVIGATGLPIALLAFAFADPGRGDVSQTGTATAGETLVEVGRNSRVLAPLLLFSVSQAIVAAGLAAWVPALLQRTYGVEPCNFGPVLGIALMIGAPVGMLGAGLAMDRLGRSGPAVAAAAASLLLILAGGIGPQASSIGAYWRWQILIIMSSGVYLPVTSTLVARTMPSRMIGTTMAMFLLVEGVVGAGLGPLVVALFTEHVFTDDPRALNWAVTTVSVVFGGTALLSSTAIIAATRRNAAKRP